MKIPQNLRGLWEKITGIESIDSNENETFIDEGGPAVKSYYSDDDYDANYGSNNNEAYTSDKVIQLHQKRSNTIHKLVKIKGTDYRNKLKEASGYYKDGHSLYLNMDEANKAATTRVIDFLGGMALYADGSLKRLSTTVYAVYQPGVDVDNDLYADGDADERADRGMFDDFPFSR